MGWIWRNWRTQHSDLGSIGSTHIKTSETNSKHFISSEKFFAFFSFSLSLVVFPFFCACEIVVFPVRWHSTSTAWDDVDDNVCRWNYVAFDCRVLFGSQCHILYNFNCKFALWMGPDTRRWIWMRIECAVWGHPRIEAGRKEDELHWMYAK